MIIYIYAFIYIYKTIHTIIIYIYYTVSTLDISYLIYHVYIYIICIYIYINRILIIGSSHGVSTSPSRMYRPAWQGHRCAAHHPRDHLWPGEVPVPADHVDLRRTTPGPRSRRKMVGLWCSLLWFWFIMMVLWCCIWCFYGL